MPSDSVKKAGKKAVARSRVSNGSKLGPEMDGRSTWARRMRDVIEDLSADLGGYDDLSEARKNIVRRCATLTVELERLESKFARREPETPDLDAYNRIAGNLRRLLESLGLEKHAPQPRDITEAAKRAEGLRLIHAINEGLSLDDRAVAVGRDQAMFEYARRLNFAVRKAIDDGDLVSPEIARLAEQLGIGTIAPEQPTIIEGTDPHA